MSNGTWTLILVAAAGIWVGTGVAVLALCLAAARGDRAAREQARRERAERFNKNAPATVTRPGAWTQED